MQNCCLHIGDMDRLIHDIETEFIRGSHRDARLDPTAGKLHRESLWMVIAPHAAAQCRAGFDHRSESKFVAPHDQRVLQQSLSFQVLN